MLLFAGAARAQVPTSNVLYRVLLLRTASGKTASLLLAALIPLVANLLFSIWQPRRWRSGDGEGP